MKFDFNHSHDSATLLMLKGKRSSAVVLGDVYNSFPNFIKQKYPAIIINSKGGASILTKPNAKPALIKAILNSKTKLDFLTWSEAPKKALKHPYSEVFSSQLENYLNDKQPN